MTSEARRNSTVEIHVPVERVMRALQNQAKGNHDLRREIDLAISKVETQVVVEKNQTLMDELARRVPVEAAEVPADDKPTTDDDKPTTDD